MTAGLKNCASFSAPWSSKGPQWLAELIAPMIKDADPAKTGVYLSTRDAGAAISVGFWTRALSETVAFVSPQDFPLTLPSSISTGIARSLRLLGPNQTLIGDADASRAAWDEAVCDLAQGIVETAVLIRFTAGDSRRQSSAQVVILGTNSDTLYGACPEDRDPIEHACQSSATPTSHLANNRQTELSEGNFI